MFLRPENCSGHASLSFRGYTTFQTPEGLKKWDLKINVQATEKFPLPCTDRGKH